jgi:hypothetical protein
MAKIIKISTQSQYQPRIIKKSYLMEMKRVSTLLFLAHFPLGKESYCPQSVRPSVTASSLQGVVGLG